MAFNSANRAMFLFYTNTAEKTLAYIHNEGKRMVVENNITLVTFKDESGVRCHFDDDGNLTNIKMMR